MTGMTERLYRAETIKCRHTVWGKLWIFMPVLTLVLAYGISGNYGTSSAYNWWYTLMMQGMVTLYCCLAGGLDRERKNRVVLSVPVKLGKIWDAKLLAGIKTVIFSNLLLTLGILALANGLLPLLGLASSMEIGLGQAAWAAGVMMVSTLWQIPFCFWMNQKWGLLPTLIINMVMTAAGVVLAVTPLWLAFPWAVLPRLMVSVVGILPNGLPVSPESITYHPQIGDPGCILPGILVTLIWLAALWAASRIWYGRKGAQTV